LLYLRNWPALFEHNRKMVTFLMMVSTGILVPRVVSFLTMDTCHAPIVYLSLILFRLPGSELLFAALELWTLGNPVIGASRFVYALGTVVIMALSLTLGWQLGDPTTGGNVPTEMCPDPDNVWYLGGLIYSVPFAACLLVLANVRPADMLCSVIVATLPLTVSAALPVFLPRLPSYCQMTIAAFVGAHAACAVNYVAGVSYHNFLVPIIVLLAPGAGAMLSILASMDRDGPSNSYDVWLDLFIKGIAYGIGVQCAIDRWGNLLAGRTAKVEHSNFERESSRGNSAVSTAAGASH